MFNYVKSSLSKAIKSRMIVLVILFLLMAFILINRLFHLQILNGEAYLNDFTMQIKKEKVIKSTRGEIYDSDGNPLAYNKLAYTVTFEDIGSYDSTREMNLSLNSSMYGLLRVIEDNGNEILMNFGIGLDKNGEYYFTKSGFNLQRFKADVYGQAYIDDMTDAQKNATAQEVMDDLVSSKYYGIVAEYTAEELEAYHLPSSFTKEEILKLTCMRSNVAANSYQKYVSTEIARDVSEVTVAIIMENKDNYPGVDVVEDSIRVYEDSKYFAPLIGYTGQISAEELEELNEAGGDYSSSDIVGKTGLEQYFESELQGSKGSKVIYVDNLGKTISEEAQIDPQAGNDIYLTIDRDLQIAAYDILEQVIAGIVWSNMVDSKEFDRESVSSDYIRIPVYDVYYALFENNIIDASHLSSEDASPVEKQIYQSFLAKETQVFSYIRSELTSQNPTAYKDLDEEWQVYISYIVNTMLMQDTGILDGDGIDRQDPTYIAWTTEETISLKEYLTYAISQGWVDVTKIPMDSEYLDANEIFNALADYIQEYLAEDDGFSRKIYKYMIKNEQLNGTDICLILFDQGILEMNVDDYNALSSGTISAYDFIRAKIYNLELTPAELALEPCSGSVVITDLTGNVLACVTYPGYDNNKLANNMDSDYYYKLYNDLSYPFYNKATQEVTAPGSTFKLVTSTAGLKEGLIDPYNTVINCLGKFEDDDPPINCWIYSDALGYGSHGPETLVSAIKDSCNYYFNTVGLMLGQDSSGEYSDADGIAKMTEYAKMYGFDAKTGIEIGETSPHIAQYDAPRAAMGQSDNAFTTSQLARYVSTLANRGTCYDLTLLDRITDSQGNVLEEKEPVVHNIVEMTDDQWDAIHTGMNQVVTMNSTSVFKDMTNFSLAGKTGTAQERTDQANHGLFVGFAPYEEPEIAFAVRITNGYSSSNAASVARDILSYKYNLKDKSEIIDGSATEVQSGQSTD
ncbi:MAG: penicillin-binding transpeptidase domain-containing protein [Candidatus Limivivens sp.]|nr:penicillin-binding transpeptidase domain-containing protein [Candidatus Limivivens sp.]